jgi:uncharacterized protein YlaI
VRDDKKWETLPLQNRPRNTFTLEDIHPRKDVKVERRIQGRSVVVRAPHTCVLEVSFQKFRFLAYIDSEVDLVQ